MQCKILFLILFIMFVFFNLTRAAIDISQLWNMQTAGIIPLGRYYSLTRCLFKEQGGYSCTGCSTALHCYPTNGAIQVECRGLFRYCRNGFCSMSQGDKCLNTDKVTETPSSNVTSHTGTSSEKPVAIEENHSSVSQLQARKNTIEQNNAMEISKPTFSRESLISFLKRYRLCRCWELNSGNGIETPSVL